jgi:hypothetical protein
MECGREALAASYMRAAQWGGRHATSKPIHKILRQGGSVSGFFEQFDPRSRWQLFRARRLDRPALERWG